jgi:hypothetical protein
MPRYFFDFRDADGLFKDEGAKRCLDQKLPVERRYER